MKLNRDDVIRWAREAGVKDWWDSGNDNAEALLECLERFTALVAAKASAAEREKSLRLWMLLDDVDTADDIAKSDDAVYRSLCRQAHQKRWAVMTGDEVDAAIRAKGETK